MKLLIAVDMEGISGVATWDHVNLAHAEYQRFRRIMTGDVNAAIEGASQAGVEEIIVTDGHWDGGNILIEELDQRAHLNSGTPSPFSMVQGIDQGVDAALFIGYHARIGTAHAILDHTWSSARVNNLWLNGRLAGETGLNAAVCGHFGAPVLMVSGDQAVANEASDWIPGIETAVVKWASSRSAAEMRSLPEARALITQTAKRAVERFKNGSAPAPLKVETPVKVTLELMYSDMADKAVLLPGATRLDGRRIEIAAADMPTAYRSARAAIGLAAR